MTFEEFFRKKRIELVALQQGEPALFSEFKVHFEQMGEKSFDHTKKYWFNKLRRQFPIPQEEKPEKVHIANPLAEQTITESLIEPGTLPKQGFVPRFKAAPVEEKTGGAAEQAQAAPDATTKPAFKPRFNPSMVKAKPVDNETPTAEPTKDPAVAPTPATDTTAAKPAFKPRFNAGMVKPKPAENETPVEEPKEPPFIAPVTGTETAPKPAFKPRFNAAMMQPKPAETEIPAEELHQTPQDKTPAEDAEVKPAYKPRFNIKTLPKKPPEA